MLSALPARRAPLLVGSLRSLVAGRLAFLGVVESLATAACPGVGVTTMVHDGGNVNAVAALDVVDAIGEALHRGSPRTFLHAWPQSRGGRDALDAVVYRLTKSSTQRRALTLIPSRRRLEIMQRPRSKGDLPHRLFARDLPNACVYLCPRDALYLPALDFSDA